MTGRIFFVVQRYVAVESHILEAEAYWSLPENNNLIVLPEDSSTISFTTSHPKNDDWTLSENFHQIIIQTPHHTSAQPHDATTDPVNSIPEDPPVTLYLCHSVPQNFTGSSRCGQAKEKKVSDQDATVRSEPRYSCVSDPWGSTGEDPSCHADAGILASYLS